MPPVLCPSPGCTGRCVSVFGVQGTFGTGSGVSGSFTLDTTLAQVTGIDLLVNQAGVTYTLDTLEAASPTPGTYRIEAGGDGADAEIFLPTTTLVGYTGSVLCSGAHQCGFFGNESYISLPSQGSDLSLSEGTVAPGLAVAPEPASWWLVLSGVSGLGIAGWRRRLL